MPLRRLQWLRWVLAFLVSHLWATVVSATASVERNDFDHSSLAANAKLRAESAAQGAMLRMQITKNRVTSQRSIVPPPPDPPFDIETFEPIEPPWQAIRAWIPADDDESPTDTPELWDQTTGTGWKAPEIDLGDGRTPILEYT